MGKLIPIIIILAALVALAWYYAGDRPNDRSTHSTAPHTVREAVDERDTSTPSVAEATQAIVGSWRSDEDARSTLVFRENGTTQDLYDGEELGTGTWRVHTGSIGELEAVTLLTTTIAGDDYTYMVWIANEQSLVVNYVSRGNTLAYTRITQ